MRHHAPARHWYEYTVFDGVEDAYTGTSRKPLKLHLKATVKFAIRGHILYIADEDGKVQETQYAKQELIRRNPK